MQSYDRGASYPSRLPYRNSNRNDRGDRDNHSKFPVELQGPQYHCVGLEQEEGIEPLKMIVRCWCKALDYTHLVDDQMEHWWYTYLNNIFPIFLNRFQYNKHLYFFFRFINVLRGRLKSKLLFLIQPLIAPEYSKQLRWHSLKMLYPLHLFFSV